MRVLLIGLAFTMVAGQAAAQYVPIYPPAQNRETTTRTYDWQSGNSYTTTTRQDGSATVRGNNYQNGTSWRTTIEADGRQRGTDAKGNQWRYNPQTKTYQNFGTGEFCRGEGARRVCF